MPAQVTIDGVACTIERLSNGLIRVSHVWPQINATHGPDTGGACTYHVHPCQRHQYEHLNAALPPAERNADPTAAAESRPWWSFGAGERAGLRE